jgi:ubiquinone/menaquinone biosynthesis C-methylase UbiE
MSPVLTNPDAEQLPFPDASIDAVISIYGVMFAQHHQQAASELTRPAVLVDESR